jgi:uncharacterized damage-inducible protein DinB
MKRILPGICLLALSLATPCLRGQVNPYKDGTPGVTGYRSEVLSEVIVQENEFIRLAEAIPADKYTWRPAPEVRSIAEVFLHVSAANYNMYTLVGVKIPQGIDTKSMEESTTDKVKVIATLKQSYAHAKQAITDLPDADLEKSMNWLGGKLTVRGVLLYIVPHIAEHLGQSIAYARMIGVVPPWSQDPPNQQADKKEASKEKP